MLSIRRLQILQLKSSPQHSIFENAHAVIRQDVYLIRTRFSDKEYRGITLVCQWKWKHGNGKRATIC